MTECFTNQRTDSRNEIALTLAPTDPSQSIFTIRHHASFIHISEKDVLCLFEIVPHKMQK